jgi:hypothetical protein
VIINTRNVLCNVKQSICHLTIKEKSMITFDEATKLLREYIGPAYQDQQIGMDDPDQQQIGLSYTAYEIRAYEKRPDGCFYYSNIPDDEPCWYFRMTFHPDRFMLCESRLVIISRNNGKILYDGGAGDEG